MTVFSLLLSLTGLSHREAGVFLDVSIDTIRSWHNGRRIAPQAVIDKMIVLVKAQKTAAAQALDTIGNHLDTAISAGNTLSSVDIAYPRNDIEAQLLGLPFLSTWKTMVAYVAAESPVPIRLVPRS